MSNTFYRSNTKINLCVNYFKYFLQLKHKKQTYLWTISNISCHSNTKKSKRKYFHKPKITICFLQSITNVLNNSNIESCNIFATKKSRKVFRKQFSLGETVYVGTKAVCGKDHKRASTAYGCKYIHLKCDNCCTNLTFIKIKSLLKAIFAKKKKS